MIARNIMKTKLCAKMHIGDVCTNVHSVQYCT